MKQYDELTNETLCTAIQAGDDYAKGILIERNRRWIDGLADHSYKTFGMDAFATSAALDDLIQVGNMALLRAAERYDPGKVPVFLAFAKKAILNAMRSEAKREYTESPLRLLDSEKVRAVLRLDDSYDVDTDSSLSECIPDDRELMPEEWHERKENARSLWEALKALNPHDREFIMLRYQLSSRKRKTESRNGILPIKEAAALAHISVERAKRIERNAFAFLKKHIEKNEERKTFQPPELSPDAVLGAKKLCEYISTFTRFHVGNIPILVCAATHRETIIGRADLTVEVKATHTDEQSSRSAYVPTWIISSASRDELCIYIVFPAQSTYASKAVLHLRINGIDMGSSFANDIEDAPDLTRWLWCLASGFKYYKLSEAKAAECSHALYCLVRDIYDTIYARFRRLGG